jgi:uncharacterized membrane protein
MDSAGDQVELPQVLTSNVRLLAELEKAALRKRSVPERICDAITAVACQFWFAIAHVAGFAAWIAINSGVFSTIKPFDPYPYSFLTLAVSLEAIFLSLAILMTQNRESHEADERARLDLQIDLLAEREATKLLQMVRALCTHHKLCEADDPELDELVNPTHPEKILRDIQTNGKSEPGEKARAASMD